MKYPVIRECPVRSLYEYAYEKAPDLRIERLQRCASGATNYQPVL
jgi:hypothetical protein